MAGNTNVNPFLGRRIALLRDDLGLTQAELAEKLGFAHRQSLQQIEADERKLSVEEMLQLMEISGRSFEYFTDPFLWDGDGAFSFRAANIDAEELDAFEKTAGGWIMLWRWLRAVNELQAPLQPGFGIGVRSTYEKVMALAEQLVTWFRLGGTPATILGPTLECELGIPVLYVDIPNGISGATCHFASGNVILVNRSNVAGRRNFDLAHELFHALTWEDMPPERVDRDKATDMSARRRETLANIFASTLLMPAKEVHAYCEDAGVASQGEQIGLEVMHAGAEHFSVSEEAFFWRLVSLELIGKEKSQQVIEKITAIASTRETHASTREVPAEVPPLFSRFFLEHLAEAIDAGRISVRRAARQLSLDVDGLEDAYRSHELSVPFDM